MHLFQVLAGSSVVLLFTAFWNVIRALRANPLAWRRHDLQAAILLILPTAISNVVLLADRGAKANQSEKLLLGTALLSSAMCTTLLIRRAVLGMCQITALERLAHIDPVTRVLTRRRITQLLEQVCLLARRRTDLLCILFIDVDDFKHINDTHGHQFGDLVLAQIGEALTGTETKVLVGRYGGDEFLVVLPETNPVAAARMAESIRESVSSTRFRTDMNGHISVTVSVGMYAMLTFQETASEMVANADLALYRAKKRGGNAVCTIEEWEASRPLFESTNDGPHIVHRKSAISA